jgi:4'-phosphopantetheinyl transferase EntD
VIEELVPSGVAVVETREDLIEVELFPEEEHSLGDPVEKRRREFVTVRACAREALDRLGVATGPIASGESGEPLWPNGVVGALTHCEGFRACAVARAGDIASVGIDAEVHAPLPDGVLDAVSSATERRMLGAAAATELHLDRVLFSAKESIYKAWFPLARRWLGFEDVEMTIDAAARTFQARLLVPGPSVAGTPLTEFRGGWRTEGGVVATAVVVPGGGQRPAA